MENDTLSFELPWPPSVNHYWLLIPMGRSVRMVIGKKGKEFREAVNALLKDTPELTGKMSLTVEVFPPDRRKRDLDNLLKATQDSMQHAGIYKDDSDIDEIHIVRKEVVKLGLLKITLRRI